MEKYDYKEQIIADIKEQMEEDGIKEQIIAGKIDIEEAREKMYDEYFDNDNITGNASGSYFFNARKAEEAICHNWVLLEDVQEEFGMLEFSKGPEHIDVCIRCYLLSECISEVIDELADEIEEEE